MELGRDKVPDSTPTEFHVRRATPADAEIIGTHRARMFHDMGDIPDHLFEEFQAASRERADLRSRRTADPDGGDACLVYHALLGDAGATPPAPMPVTGCGWRCRAATSATCWTTRCGRGSKKRSIACAPPARTSHDIDIHHAADIAPVYLLIVLADAAAYHAATLEAMPERYTPPVRLRLEMGRYVLAEDYVRALAGREVLRREVDAALAQHDALVLPTLPIPAPPIGANS